MPKKLRKCYYITPAAVAKVKRAAKKQGLSMSDIIEQLIKSNLK